MNKLIYALLVLLISSCSSQSLPELHLFMWADYIKPELIWRFEKEHRCRVVIDTYDSNEAMYAKLKLGVTGYDIIFPSYYIFNLMLAQNMVEELDYQAIPNTSFLDPDYVDRLSTETKAHGIPYMVSFAGIGYRSDKLAHPITSWSIFGNPAYKGRMTMLNDMRETLGACLRYLGFSVNTKNVHELNQAADLLISWKPNLAKFENEQYKNGIATAEFLIVQGYNGDLAQVAEENPYISFAYPSEGTSFSIDLAAIPRHSPNPELAKKFLNFILQPDVAAENISFTKFLSPNKEAYLLLSADQRANRALFPPEEVLQKAELLEPLDQVNSEYIRAWDRAKAE
ncbi:MAG: polyamine ABC transporter substrate-binding protein [Parachlamydiaceae bacterium]